MAPTSRTACIRILIVIVRLILILVITAILILILRPPLVIIAVVVVFAMVSRSFTPERGDEFSSRGGGGSVERGVVV